METLCSHFGQCGGCVSQCISYPEQLKQKQRQIDELFQPQLVQPIVGSPSHFGYRGKMEYSFSEDKKGNRYLGLYIPKSRGKVINLNECLISRGPAGKLLERVRAWWVESNLRAYFPPRDEGSLQTVTLRSGVNQMVILTVSGNSAYALTKEQLKGFVKAVRFEETTSVYLLVRHIAKGRPTKINEMHLAGPAYLEEVLCNTSFHISPQAFFQPNRDVAERMFTKVIGILELTGREKVLDLYCGIGTIGMILSPHVRQVVGVELNAMAVCDAKDNIERLGLENMQVYQFDLGKGMGDLVKFFTPDIIVVDPPRVGLDAKTKILIGEILPKKIIYISCNPKSQAVDISELEGYKIEVIVPFDQFPNTPHVENIILLTGK